MFFEEQIQQLIHDARPYEANEAAPSCKTAHPQSTTLESVGDPGPGKWVTIYANPDHAYIEVAGIYLDTAAGLGNPPNPPSIGPRWSTVGTGPAGFVARHPAGL